MKKTSLLFVILLFSLIGFGQSLPDNILENECNAPLPGTPWNIHLLYSSFENDIASYSPLLAGDIDNNGVIDIVVARYSDNFYHSNGMYVFSGQDLSVQSSFNLPDTIYNYNGYAIGRYPMENGTLQGAIFVHSYDKRIRAYTINGTLLNVSDRPTSCDGMLSLADFNGDGFPEIYSGNDIFDAATLKWLCSGPANGNRGLGFRGPPLHTAVNTHHTYYAMSLAYNVLGDEKQELVCGNTIYDVSIVSRTNPTLNSVTVNKTVSPPSGFSQDGHVLIADFDLDGQDEVLVIRDNSDDHTLGNCYIYAYKPTTGQILFQKIHQAYCTSYPFIGNIDNDPHPEIVILEKQLYGPKYIFCWRYSNNGLTSLWEQEHTDSSGQTGITLFDFNQDGIMELVYRDNRSLRIINGSGKSHITGNDTICPYNMYSLMMSAGTGVEYPIVADVNNDGSAEIVCTGILHSTDEVGYGGIHVLGNPGGWSPARPVWNQYMYHVTNVNEDLTIPTSCFDKATAFTGSDGTTHRPYNNFLQQACYITPQGEPYNPSGYVVVNHFGEGCGTYTFQDSTYTENGVYEYYIENPLGCDTLMLVQVELGDTIRIEQSETVCTSYSWNGTTYDMTGDYEQYFKTESGCDSIVTLHLTIDNQVYTDIAVSTCDSYTWNGTTYNESGTYTQTFPAANDCDSIVTLNLTIKNSIQVGPIHGEDLIFYQTNGEYTYSIDPVPGCFGYEWDIDGPWSIESSPDSPECTVDIYSPGTATLKVRVYTECGFIERSLYINHDARPDIVIYPNPTMADFSLKLYGMEGTAYIIIYDYLGQLIDRFSVEASVGGTLVPYSLTGKAAGVYLICVMNNFEVLTRRVIKDTPSTI